MSFFGTHSPSDVAEAAHTTPDEMQRADVRAVEALLNYVAQNAGLLKEAAAAVVEKDAAMLRHLPGSILQRVSEKLTSP